MIRVRVELDVVDDSPLAAAILVEKRLAGVGTIVRIDTERRS